MAFRGGVASANAVDTRDQPTGAGVRIVQDNSDLLHPRGLVRFSDGFGDPDALIYQHADGNPRADPSFTLAGGLTLNAGHYAGLDAPTLDLAVIQNGDGSTRTAATLTGGPLHVDQPAIADDAGGSWRAVPLTPNWVNWDNGGNACVYRRDAAGTVHYRGIAKIPAGGSLGVNASSLVAFMPGGGFFVPGANDWRVIAVLNASGILVGYSQAWMTGNGGLTLANNTSAVAGAGYGFVLGFSFPGT